MILGMVIGTIAIVLVTVVIGLLVDRKVAVLPVPEREDARKAREKQRVHAAGESPGTALHIRAGRLETVVDEMRCLACKGAMQMRGDELVRYDGADLHVVRLACARCDVTRSVYVATT